MERNSSAKSRISKRRKSKRGKGKKNNENLIDSSWEVIHPDPPNIYTLFVNFDKQFFWNKLRAVNVVWSKRMTSCAGTCTFKRRIGECTVRLSEPLLKLRPRKDLIQTLLHEMIHAYLFLTRNDWHREGHGPEFHKHMYRINNKTGINITVYHNFHDEVRLYKTHWWRCNGPCQYRHPFYGWIKRATNRAPGPYDHWWLRHQCTCNGTFIKKREPDKTLKNPGDFSTKSVPVTNIRQYLHNLNSNQVPIHTIADLSTYYKNLHQKTNSNSLQINNSNSFSESLNSSDDELLNETVKTIDNRNEHQLVNVRNFWANNYPVNGSSKRPVSELALNNSKKSRSEDTNFDEICTYSSDTKLVEVSITMENVYKNVCDFWTNKYPDKNKKGHTSDQKNESVVLIDSQDSDADSDVIEIVNEIPVIDLCVDEDTICPICSKSVETSEFNKHIDSCLAFSFNDNFEELDDPTTNNKSPHKEINCFVCNKLVNETLLNVHLETCMADVFEDEIIDPENNNEF
ncbi:DNA-dependent metalloprotease dvc-1-like [Chrysoperla carnea]|uniref:DNA-dependent metalloprotease dvc-1-like n=1 Tax=Chrysoperla carnea TaxID=189513 RepID=UPI001D073576|nr:DNA-dependent metalloprotease dvc-1-like [Chrysoperla carnea]